jgi:energy-coupling factor transport system permease protein
MKQHVAYKPGHTFLHALHPLVKAGWLLAATLAFFVLKQPWAIASLLALSVAAYPLNDLRLEEIPGTQIAIVTAVVLGGLQLIFNRSGIVLASVGPLSVTRIGVNAAIIVAGRFLSVILLSYLFVLTTDPNDLAYGLMQVGLPYRYGFALITALRLVPIFEREAQRVYQAQVVRGAGYGAKGPRRFFILMRQFLLPMLSSALGKVDALAVSMEGRGFGRYPTRTFYRPRSITRRDRIGLAGLVAFITLILVVHLVLI